MIKGKDQGGKTHHPCIMFDTAPTLTPSEALLTGSAVFIGGIIVFGLVLLATRWFAKR
ncbi:MAG: hypothetical protein K2X44_08275 [Magnetospirillum sp.]|nr:hypothetical protein [Magnetospirillum sp.]